MAFNAVTLAAIVSAVWAHPQGVSYLEKIDQIAIYAEACGNPCCQGGSGQRKREEELWKNLPEFYLPKEKPQEVVQIEPIFLPARENVSPEELVEVLKSVVAKIQSPAPLATIEDESDDEEAILLLLGVL